MDIIVSDDIFDKSDETIKANILNFIEVFNWAKEHDVKLYRREGADNTCLYENMNRFRKFIIPISYFSKLDILNYTNNKNIEPDDIYPRVEKKLFEVIICGFEHLIKYIFLFEKNYKDNDKYIIEKENFTMKSIDSLDLLKLYRLYEPEVKSAKEVFERLARDYEEVIISDKALKTCENVEDIYKQFGYSELLNVLQIAHEILFPYLLNHKVGMAEKEIFSEFKKKSGVEVSRETPATIKKYGKERKFEIQGTVIQGDIHIKIMDARIYIAEYNGHVCIGHAGKHLHTVRGY